MVKLVQSRQSRVSRGLSAGVDEIAQGIWEPLTGIVYHTTRRPPVARYTAGGVSFGLRADTFTMQELNKTGANYSFVPALTPGRGLPLVQHMGDITLRVRSSSAAPGQPWSYFATAWGPGSAVATPVSPLPPGALAAHDITALLAATNATGKVAKPPVKVVRIYGKPKPGTGPGITMAFKVSWQYLSYFLMSG